MSYDPEKNGGDYSPNSEMGAGQDYTFNNNEEKPKGWAGFKHSFKRKDVSHLERAGLSRVEIAALATADAPLNRDLKSRHLQMIAIGGAIGTGLFIGSGGALSEAGPGGLIIGYFLIGIMIFFTVQSLGELGVRFPISGAFATYSSRFLDPAWGFAMGWNYAMQWLVVLPLELVAASSTIKFWSNNGQNAAANANPDAWVAIFYVLILCINVFGVRGYGEAEFVFSIIKVIAVIGFIILSIVLVCGGGPTHEYLGGKYYVNPGSFANGFKGVVSCFVTAAFSFAGTELVGLAAAETDNPRKTLPRAAKQVFWRITLFYLISLTLVGMLVPYTNEDLLSASGTNTAYSPFVLAIEAAKIGVLPSIMNVVVLISVLSVGNSSVFGCSRTLAALAAQGQAPAILGYIDNAGRPLVAVGLTLTFGLLSFVAGSDKSGDVFDWLLALSGLSSIFTWGSICLCHIRFRRGLKVQGVSTDELAFRAIGGTIGSWFGFILNVLVLIGQFWVAVWPIGGQPNATTFFQLYLAAPVILFYYFSYKIYYRTPFVRAKDMDLFVGMREVDMDQLREEINREKAELRERNIFIRIYYFWC